MRACTNSPSRAGVSSLTRTRPSKGNVAAIREQVAQRLFPEEDPVGKNIRVGEHDFLVVGVIEERSRRKHAGEPKDSRLEAYIPLTTMRLRIGDQETAREDGALPIERFELSRIEMTVSRLEQIDATAEIIKNLLDRRHDDETYTVTTSLDALRPRR
jgi:putative ABC transport system permease protein